MSERMLAAARRDEDQAETSLRPQTLSEFIGQPKVCSNLKVFIEAARGRREALDHVLFAGPPGLGKTTLAQIVARELGVNFRATSGPVIAKAGDLAALLTNLEDRDVLFIDEIHRLNPAVEEILYPALEDFQLDLIIGEGPAARSVRIDLARFTLIGATTRTGLLTTPLRERFGIPISDEEIAETPFFRPAPQSAERQYLVNRRKKLGGFLPQRVVSAPPIEVPKQELFAELLKGSGKFEMSTTITQLLSALATKSVRPSGETATPSGVLPSGDSG